MTDSRKTAKKARSRSPRFCDLAGRENDDLPLDEVALAIADEERPGARRGATLRRLDNLAEGLQKRLPSSEEPIELLESLAEFLFKKEGFAGNTDDYYDLRNSFLDDVVDRKRGIPISLSIVAIEVARRVGLALVGVGFPGHFLVTTKEESGIYLDAFRGGQLLQQEECRSLLETLSAGHLTMKASDLEPVTGRQVATRVLQNIKGIHLRQGRLDAAVETVNRILLLFPEATGIYRERGLMYLQLEAFRFARDDLRTYLERVQDPPDRDAIEHALQRAEKMANMLL